jgi:hypothetical protein
LSSRAEEGPKVGDALFFGVALAVERWEADPELPGVADPLGAVGLEPATVGAEPDACGRCDVPE